MLIGSAAYAPVPEETDCGDDVAARETIRSLAVPRRLFDYAGPADKEAAAIARREALYRKLLDRHTRNLFPIALNETTVNEQWNYLFTQNFTVGAFTVAELDRRPALATRPGAFLPGRGSTPHTVALNVFDWSQDPDLTAAGVVAYGYAWLRLEHGKPEARRLVGRLSVTTREHLAGRAIPSAALHRCLAARAEEETLMRLYARWRDPRRHPEMRTGDLEARLDHYRRDPADYLAARLSAARALPTDEAYVVGDLVTVAFPEGWLPPEPR